MVVYFDKNGKIMRASHNVMTPTLPANMSLVEKIVHYNELGLDFVCLNYELGASIFDYKVALDENTNFIGLVPLHEEVK